MRKFESTRQTWLAVLCAAALALAAGATPARADYSDPLFLFAPTPPVPSEGTPVPPPTGYLSGPCGIAVDSAANFYVADYYHRAVDVFSPSHIYKGQLLTGEPPGGPCGLALDSADNLYVNGYHRDVVGFPPFPSFGVGTPLAGAPLDSSHPTGVAVDFASGDVYVNERTHVARYEAPIEPGEEPVAKIGLGTLGDGYGLAISRFPTTLGYLYVPDAADGTVKVYDPAVDPVEPVEAIDAHDAPGGGFVSLRDSAVAVDRATGKVYVVDDVQPELTEEPQATVKVFGPGGGYRGHLKYNIVDARPAGIAVDNSFGINQGRVYVTTGNTTEAGVYAYPQNAETTLAPVPAALPLGQAATAVAGSIAGAAAEPAAPSPAPSRPSSQEDAVAASSSIVQRGPLRVKVGARLAPRSLPRRGRAPIAVSVKWSMATTDGTPTPKLKRLRIEVNRHGRFDTRGLPTCRSSRIHPASTARALASCRSALVGRGRFTAEISLRGQQAYSTTGRLLVFNARRHGRPVLLGHIYSPRPFATSFLIPFAVRKASRGAFGTALVATLPKGLAAWGNLTGIEMTLSRRYRYRGRRHSYLSAGCPAPKGFSRAIFPLARTSFSLAGSPKLTETLTGACRVAAHR